MCMMLNTNIKLKKRKRVDARKRIDQVSVPVLGIFNYFVFILFFRAKADVNNVTAL